MEAEEEAVEEGKEEAGRDGAVWEDILIFIMILSYKANTPVSLSWRGYTLSGSWHKLMVLAWCSGLV